MIERLLIIITLTSIALLAYQICKRCQLRRVSQADPLLASVQPGTPVIVYFTVPSCIPCLTQQRPALEQIQAELGDQVQIVQVDATEDPDTADRWGVMSAPTTFVVDGRGQAHAVNHGVADASQLKSQLLAIREAS